MNSKDLNWNFHRVMVDFQDNSQRLKELSKIIASKIYNFEPRCDEERNALNSEYQLLVLCNMLYDFEKTSPVLPSIYETQPIMQQLFEHLTSNREFRLLLTLMNWVETIKLVDVSKSSGSTLCPHYESNDSGPLDPDSLLRRNERYKDHVKRVMKDCFDLIRTGQLKNAQMLLRNYDAVWLSLAIGGLCPYFNSQIYQNSEVETEYELASCFKTIDSGLHAVEGSSLYAVHEYGNQNLELYMKTCWVISRSKEASDDEKAVFGSFCGNLDAVLQRCDRNPHDHFWAYVRTIFLFRLKEFLSYADEGFRKAENTEDFFDFPKKIPDTYPNSLESVVSRVSKQFFNQMSANVMELQFSLVTCAVKDRKDLLINRLVACDYQEYRRAVVHCFICMRNLVHDIPREIEDKFEFYLVDYLRSLIYFNTELDIVIYYIRYLSFSKDPYYIEFFIDLFRKFNEESSHRKIVEQLYRYSKVFCQGILAKIAYSEIESLRFDFTRERIIDELEAANKPHSYSDRLIELIHIPVPPESLNSILEVIRKLALLGKYKLGSILVAKLHNTQSDKNFELRYWGSFFLATDIYIKYLSTKHETPSIYTKKVQSHQIFESLQNLDYNQTLITERNQEKCKHLAMQLVIHLEDVSGIKSQVFPLNLNTDRDIMQFKEKWWKFTLFWLIDGYKELKKDEELHTLKQLILTIWSNQIVEDVRNSLLKYI